jgi:hypothetical protein
LTADLAFDLGSALSLVLNLESAPDLQTFSHSQVEEEIVLSPVPESESIDRDLLSSQVNDRLCLESIETTCELKVSRSVTEVACQVRANLTSLSDELLLEFLHHPQQELIQETIELADELVAAQTRERIEDSIAGLERSQKLELWNVLSADERVAIEVLMTGSDLSSEVETSMIVICTKLRRNLQRIRDREYPALVNCEVIARNGMDWVVRSACGSSFNVSNYAIESGLWEIELDEVESSSSPSSREFFVGMTVRTLTGLVGVVRHVFQSMTKPFLVHHESLGRTILYRSEDLWLSS